LNSVLARLQVPTYSVLIYVASYAIKIDMLRPSYVSYVGFSRKKGKRVQRITPFSLSHILRNIIYIVSIDIDFYYATNYVTTT
jgi:hypothetical protein